MSFAAILAKFLDEPSFEFESSSSNSELSFLEFVANDPNLRKFQLDMKRHHKKTLLRPLCHSDIVWRTKRGKSYWFYTVKYLTKTGGVRVVSRRKPGYKAGKQVPKPRIIIEKGKKIPKCSGKNKLNTPSRKPPDS